MENYLHDEGYGFHLSINSDGVVSLWDTRELAQNVRGETYLWLDLTERQRLAIEAAQEKAPKGTSSGV